MGRIIVTGDKHGNFFEVYEFCQKENTTTDDILIVAGDAGFNYHLTALDEKTKRLVAELPITILVVHGNHEERAWNILSYQYGEIEIGKNKITGWYEKQYPNIIFLDDFYTAILNGKRYLFLGGAYSIDKQYRLRSDCRWFESEQISPEKMEYILNKIKTTPYCYDYVITHTAPLKFEPTELFLFGVDQSKVDKRTEIFLDAVEELIEYEKWIFAHYHGDIDKGKVRVIYHDFVELG